MSSAACFVLRTSLETLAMVDKSKWAHLTFDGRMVEEKCNDRRTAERTVTGNVFGRYGGSSTERRKVGRYSYRLVHTPESVRLLDLRLDIAELEDVTYIAELFTGCIRGILTHAIDGEVELGGGEPTGINDQVRYKDS